jgi:hypothetical protein
MKGISMRETKTRDLEARGLEIEESVRLTVKDYCGLRQEGCWCEQAGQLRGCVMMEQVGGEELRCRQEAAEEEGKLMSADCEWVRFGCE